MSDVSKINRRAELKNMFITEYDEEKAFAEQKAEGRAEGMAIGEEKGKMKAFIGLVKDGLLTVAHAAEKVNMTVPEFEAAMQTF